MFSYANAMNFLYMKYFCDAVVLGSLTAASRANFVTPSAITQGINKLESSLNCALLARHPNRLRLTPEGQRAFLEMSEVLKSVIEIKRSISDDYTNVIGDLEFACTHSFALAVISPLIRRFRREYPQIKVNFSCSANLSEIKGMLRSGRIDFGIAPFQGDFSGFSRRTVFEGNYGVYVSNEVDPDDEGYLGFILPEPEDTSYFRERYFSDYGICPAVILEVGSWEVIANLALEGVGIGYFPDYIAQKKAESLRPHQLGFDLPKYEICAFSPEGMRLRRSSEIFLSYFLGELNDG